MAKPTSYFDSHQSKDPASPLSLQRALEASVFSSPSASHRIEEETLVLEIGSRFLRAGFAGENTPRHVFGFGPETQRRAADYRRWEHDYEPFRRKRRRGQGWGEAHELWRMDLRSVDLALVADKLERALREASTTYFIMGNTPKKLVLALPSELPHPLLDVILTALFTYFQHPGITMLSTPVLSVVAAGTRSALVIDIGWSETVVTGISEYREICRRRSVRAGKLLTLAMGESLEKQIKPKLEETNKRLPLWNAVPLPEIVSFEESEEVLMRLGWCRGHEEAKALRNGKHAAWAEDSSPIVSQRKNLFAIREDEKSAPRDASQDTNPDPLMSFSLKSTTPPTTCHLPFSLFAEPAETALFASSTTRVKLDDHELPIPLLAYLTLLSLPVDVRGLCMARIIIVGGGSKIPGVKRRIVDEISALVEARGWNSVWGHPSDMGREALVNLTNQQESKVSLPSHLTPSKCMNASSTENPAPSLTKPRPDLFQEKLRRLEVKDSETHFVGRVRGVESDGAWVGGSLIGSLKVKGVVEVERAKFLQQGLAGATRGNELTNNRSSSTVGDTKTGVNAHWTLGPWA